MPRINNKHDSPESYEHWELALPEIPPRSALYQIRPIGIGTAETECFTSYLARLARAHNLSLGALSIRYLFPLVIAKRAESGVSFTRLKLLQLSSANGADTFANDLLPIVERLTFVTGIVPSTFIKWADVVSRLELLRHYRAWCSDCYAEWGAGGNTLYDPLLWAVRPVKVCPRHQRFLAEHCPRCQRRSWPGLSYYLPGFCSQCRAWLGRQDHQPVAEALLTADIDLNYEQWAADNIGSLIAASATLSAAPRREDVTAAVNHCCNLLMEGNPRLLAHLLGVANTTARLWVQGKNIPPLKTLAKLSFLTRVPLLKLLTEPAYVLASLTQYPVEIGGGRPRQIRQLHRKGSLACQRVREEMEAALKETPPPSLEEVAQRLGYRHPTTLRVKFPELSKQISAGYRSSAEYKSRQQSRRAAAQGIPNKAEQRKLLEQELEKSCPASLKEVARRLGYSGSYSLSRRFSDLCQALLEKRRRQLSLQATARLQQYRLVLNSALCEEPPPTLSAVARRFTEFSVGFLHQYFAPECQRLVERRAEYRKHSIQAAGERLQQALRETPPRSLNRLAKEIGCHSSTLLRNHPDICRSISERYENHIRNLAADRKKTKPPFRPAS
jgi:transcriptional regulator with XRE-family HTH domain